MTWPFVVARLALAAVFGAAAVAKLRSREGTQRTLAEYGVAPRFVGPGAWVLPAAELVVATLLVPRSTATVGAFAALGLLACFSAAIVIRLRRGERPDCACFGQLHSAPVGAGTLARNALLGLMAYAVAFADTGIGVEAAVDQITGADGLLGPAVLVLAVVVVLQLWWSLQLFRQSGRLIARIHVLEMTLADGPADDASGLGLGESVPPFELLDTDGRRWSLAGLLVPGRPVALVFSDPECPACDALAAELPDRMDVDVDVVVITRAGDSARYAGVGTVLLQQQHEVAFACRVSGVPTAFLVDPDGRVSSAIASGAPAILNLLAGERSPAPVLEITSVAGAR